MTKMMMTMTIVTTTKNNNDDEEDNDDDDDDDESYSPSWTQRRDSSSTFQSFHISRWPSVMSFTGFQSSVRSQYKIGILVRNSIVGSSPPYLQELCLPVASVLGRQHLRSAGRNDLLVPQFRTVNYGLRGFAISGPRLWNTLPHDIRQSVGNLNLFKNKLKTYFFQLQQRH